MLNLFARNYPHLDSSMFCVYTKKESVVLKTYLVKQVVGNLEDKISNNPTPYLSV